MKNRVLKENGNGPAGALMGCCQGGCEWWLCPKRHTWLGVFPILPLLSGGVDVSGRWSMFAGQDGKHYQPVATVVMAYRCYHRGIKIFGIQRCMPSGWAIADVPGPFPRGTAPGDPSRVPLIQWVSSCTIKVYFIISWNKSQSINFREILFLRLTSYEHQIT